MASKWASSRMSDLRSKSKRSKWSERASLGRLEQRRKTRNLLLQIVAQLGSCQEKIPICFAAVHRILVCDDNQSNVLTRRVAQRSLHDEFSNDIFGAVPAGIKEGDAGFDDHHVIRIIRIPYPIRIRSAEHRVRLGGRSGRHAVKRHADEFGVRRHDLLGQRLHIELCCRRSPVLGLLRRWYAGGGSHSENGGSIGNTERNRKRAAS